MSALPDPFEQLREALGAAGAGGAAGAAAGLIRLRRAAGGQLEGVLLMEGQEAQLQAAVPPALARLLRQLADESRGVLYSCLGSESEYGVAPVLLAAGAPRPVTPGDTRAAASGDDDSGGGSGGDDSDSGGGDGGREWLTPAAAAALAALGVPEAFAAARFAGHAQRTFGSAEDFLSYMEKDHLKLSGPSPPPDPRAAALLAPLRRLAGGGASPFVQLLSGGEGLWNPLPLFWLARVRGGGAAGGGEATAGAGCAGGCEGLLVGLASGVVWT